MKLWRIFGQVQNKKTDCKFVLCPVCGNKTRTMIQENTEMKNFPLYCPIRYNKLRKLGRA